MILTFEEYNLKVALPAHELRDQLFDAPYRMEELEGAVLGFTQSQKRIVQSLLAYRVS